MAEWVAACDQPFDEVEKPEFRWVLDYLCPGVHIPHWDTLRRLIMKLGEETFEGTKEMIDVVFTITIYSIACKLIQYIHTVEPSMSLQHVVGCLDIQ